MTTSDNLPAIASWSVPDRLKYAHELAASGLLPDSFRKQPANVLYAIEYGIALRVDPVVAITEIHVIKGKPCPSSAFMSALVRRAGHKLRIKVERDDNGNPMKAVATLIRADDPDFEFVSEWSVARAQRAGLFKQNENYAKYTEQMLKARAQGEVCRDGAKEALLGLSYLPEELGAVMNEDGSYVVTDVTAQAGASVREAAAAAQAMDGKVMATNTQLHDLAKLMDAKGVTDKLGYLHLVHPDHTFKSAAELTSAQAAQVANALNRGEHLPPATQSPDEAQNSTAPASDPTGSAPDNETPQTGGNEDLVDGDVVEDEPAGPKVLRDLGILMTELGITPHTGRGSTAKNDEARFAWLSAFLGVEIEGSTKNLTHGQAQSAVDELKRLQVERARRRASLYKQIDESFTRLGISAAEDRFRDLSDLFGRPVLRAEDLSFVEVEEASDLLEQALGTEQPRPTWDKMLDAAKAVYQGNQVGQAEGEGGF